MPRLALSRARRLVVKVGTGTLTDAAAYGYFVYFQLSRDAGPNLMPIAASVSYRLP